MTVMGHVGPRLPPDFKFPFENIYIKELIKSNLINEMANQLGQQIKNKMQVKVEANLFSAINLKCKL